MTMTAGEVLDAAIAERVMGWRVHFRNTAWWVDAAEANGITTKVRASTCSTDRWSPSTRLADAWRVVEAMRAKGYQVQIDARHVGVWGCAFMQDNAMFTAEGDTIAEAVCRAALAAH
jgi:hypothetical protein